MNSAIDHTVRVRDALRRLMIAFPKCGAQIERERRSAEVMKGRNERKTSNKESSPRLQLSTFRSKEIVGYIECREE